MDDFEEFKTSVEEINIDTVKAGGELEVLKMWLNGYNLMINLQWMRSYLFWKSEESDFMMWNLLLVKVLW